MTIADPPNLADFLLFIRGVMGIGTAVLPDDAPVIPMTLSVAEEIVNLSLSCASHQVYSLAVYNLAGDNVIRFAPDQPNSRYFADLRETWKVNAFIPGAIASASDEGTSASYATPEFMKHLTMSDIQNLKTPYGRQYLAFAQMYGTLWGVT